jgi:putative CocE/NonD family hydrolase
MALGVVAVIPPARPGDTPKEAASQKKIDLTWGVKIPLRDGVKLNATVYRPHGVKKARPVIFTLTPYIADSYHDRAKYFAEHGYPFVLVDVRGRGNSEGRFEPFANEGPDGHDVVEWLARQPWCNGKVAMWGGSYAGFDQWATLKEFPPHLATIVPAAAAHPGVDIPAPGGIFMSYLTRWLAFTSGAALNQKLFQDEDFWIQKYRQSYLTFQPFRKLDALVGFPSESFQKWVAHRTPDAYWDAMVPDAKQYARMDRPILTITGHYDDDQAGAMAFYRRHMRHGTAAGRAQHYLILGPWDHAGTRSPREEFGGLHFGKASLVDLNKLHKEWYDWTMGDAGRPAFLKDHVAYYVAGAGKWKYAASLDAIRAPRRKFYLSSFAGQANDVFHSGTLREGKPGQAQPDKYVYDPLDVRPAELERAEVKDYVMSQRKVLSLFGHGLVYHSEPFARATEITGYLKLVAWVALDVPDTDFQVTLYEIRPDGTSILLTEDQLRARYRRSLRKEELIKPGEVNRYDFTGFTFFSRQLAEGSRLRLVFRSPNSIHWEKNYNSGGKVETETRKDARKAHVTLYHDAEHPSYVEIPVVEPPARQKPAG